MIITGFPIYFLLCELFYSGNFGKGQDGEEAHYKGLGLGTIHDWWPRKVLRKK